MSYVYIIGPDAGPYKIGITGDLAQRMSVLQKNSPSKLNLFAAWLTEDKFVASVMETAAHKEFIAAHSHSEWFFCPLDAAITFLDAMALGVAIDAGSITFAQEQRKPGSRKPEQRKTKSDYVGSERHLSHLAECRKKMKAARDARSAILQGFPPFRGS